MSGSYERPTRPPYTLPPPATPLRSRTPTNEPTSGPVTGGSPHTYPPQQLPPDDRSDPYGAYSSSTQPYTQDPFPAPPQYPEPELDRELRADGHPTGATVKEPSSAPVVPASSVTSRSLTLVIAIMCFLACLTAGGVYLVNQAASAWLKDVASEVTVQVQPREGLDTEKVVREVAAFVARQPGVYSVKPMSLEDSSALIEPWLGKSDALRSLPVPRMIAVVLSGGSTDLEPLRQQLGQRFKDTVSLDDHRVWQQQIRTVTRSLALGGLAILMLVGAATTAIIVSATKSAMASNREIVEVLHLVGATDRFIAREFEKHFLRLGVRAGVVGAVFAMLVFLGLPTGMELLGGQAMSDLRWMMGSGVLDAPGYSVLIAVVVVIACLCMLTSRLGVYRILNDAH